MSRIGDFADDDVAGWIRHAGQWRMGRMLRTLDIGQGCGLTLPSRAQR